MSSELTCPACGAAVPDRGGAGRWRVCPHCRETFDRESPGAAAGERPPAVVFEDVTPPTAARVDAGQEEDSGIIRIRPAGKSRPRPAAAEPPVKRAATRPAERSRRASKPTRPPVAERRRRDPEPKRGPGRPKPPRAKTKKRKPPAEPADWLTDDGLSDLAWEDETAPPPPPSREARPPRATGRARKKRKPRPRRTRRPDRDGAADVGFAIMILLTLLLTAPALLNVERMVDTGEGPTWKDGIRWTFTAIVLLGLWAGSKATRLIWSVLMWLVTLLMVGAAVLVQGSGDPRGGLVVAQSLIIAAAVFVLSLMLWNPWFTAFLERRSGER